MSLRMRARVSRVFETLDELGRASVVRPRWNEGGEIVEPGSVGVGVSGDVGAGGAGGVDLGNDFWHASPIVFAGDFDMPDLNGDVGIAADAQGLVDGLEHGIALVAHVSGVDAAEFGGFAGECDYFRRPGVGGGSVFERGGNADGAVFHGVAHECFHLFELIGSRLHVIVAEDDAAHLCGTDIVGHVDADSLLLEAREILAEVFASRE